MKCKLLVISLFVLLFANNLNAQRIARDTLIYPHNQSYHYTVSNFGYSVGANVSRSAYIGSSRLYTVPNINCGFNIGLTYRSFFVSTTTSLGRMNKSVASNSEVFSLTSCDYNIGYTFNLKNNFSLEPHVGYAVLYANEKLQSHFKSNGSNLGITFNYYTLVQKSTSFLVIFVNYNYVNLKNKDGFHEFSWVYNNFSVGAALKCFAAKLVKD